MSERTEALLRIPIGIIAVILLGIWKFFMQIAILFHWVYTIFSGERSKTLADFCNRWITYEYTFWRYLTFATNKRPFPFNDLRKDIEKVDM